MTSTYVPQPSHSYLLPQLTKHSWEKRIQVQEHQCLPAGNWLVQNHPVVAVVAAGLEEGPSGGYRVSASGGPLLGGGAVGAAACRGGAAVPTPGPGPATPEEEVFIIMEPNISFQKCSYVPLMILEKWYREKGSNWKGKVILVNGDRFLMVPHFMENVKPYLKLFQDNRVEITGRRDIVSTLQEWPTATFILHNYNNEFNYMTLELLWCGFPVLHNSPSWMEFGYGYKGADLAGGAELVEAARTRHVERYATYRAHAELLAWKYSPYNPNIHAAWDRIIKNRNTE